MKAVKKYDNGGIRVKKNYKNGGIFPPKIQQMKNNLEPVIYDGMLDEVVVTPYTSSEYALGETMGNKATGGLKPVYPVFDVMTAGLGQLRKPFMAGAKGLQRAFKKGNSIADNIIPLYKKGSESYARQMKVPTGANLKISDDIFDGGTLIGKGEAFTKQETLNRIADFKKDLSPVPFTYTHGTGANALEGIFKQKGLFPASKLKESGNLKTGEFLFKESAAKNMFTPQTSVSTASIANPSAAAQYAIDYGKGKGNFPVVFGINPKAGARSRMRVPTTDVKGEVMFNKGIGLDEITNIFIPDANKAEFIEKYGNKLGNIKLGSFEDYVNVAQPLSRRKIKGGENYLYKQGGIIKYKK